MTASTVPRTGKVIVAADDQPENLVILAAVLEAHGHTFFGASNGVECISLANRTNPRLILLDIQMPEMDGIETCRRLRNIWALSQTPIAFLTARKSADDVREGLAAGGNDFIGKPFTAEKLLARVDHWTSRRINAA